jgi:hypothetical protein
MSMNPVSSTDYVATPTATTVKWGATHVSVTLQNSVDRAMRAPLSAVQLWCRTKRYHSTQRGSHGTQVYVGTGA